MHAWSRVKRAKPNLVAFGREEAAIIAGGLYSTPGRPLTEAPLTPGKRLVPMQLIRHIDDWIVNILDDMPSNGRFHPVIFGGDLLAS